MTTTDTYATELTAASRRQAAYFSCRREPLQSVAVRRDAVAYLACKVADAGGHMSEEDERLYLRVLAPVHLLRPLAAFYALVFEISAPGVEAMLDKILPS